jgi:crotonobetainyl-CoA:carnitine CoA-transferase CaiB-like acyl-CoA transferase
VEQVSAPTLPAERQYSAIIESILQFLFRDLRVSVVNEMSSAKPLSGLVVVEIGHSIAAPYAGMILGELGAEVVKVENPRTGDAARGWGPPFLEGAATCFHAVNRAKGSITVDLADPEDAARLRKLIVERADVVLHNLKFGALDRYGLGGADLVAAKPDLVFCNLGAFGAVGPLRDKPGYDPMIQAYSGLMSLLGEDGRPPVRVPASIIDMGAGMWSVIGILAALQERGRTGKGGVVDTSLYETGLAWMSIYLAGYLANRELPARHGSGVDMIVPYQAFAAEDGYMMVAAGNDNLFRRLAAVLDRPGLAEDPRFHSNKDRVVNRTELIPILSDIFAIKPRAEWARLLDAAGIPNGPINTLDQVVGDPQTQALGIIQIREGSELGLVGLPLSFDLVRPAFEKAGPALGEDNSKLGR